MKTLILISLLKCGFGHQVYWPTDESMVGWKGHDYRTYKQTADYARFFKWAYDEKGKPKYLILMVPVETATQYECV